MVERKLGKNQKYPEGCTTVEEGDRTGPGPQEEPPPSKDVDGALLKTPTSLIPWPLMF